MKKKWKYFTFGLDIESNNKKNNIFFMMNYIKIFKEILFKEVFVLIISGNYYKSLLKFYIDI